MFVRIIQSFLVGLGAATLGFFLATALLTWHLQHTPHTPGIGAVAGGISMSAPFILLPFALGITWNLFITRRRNSDPQSQVP